jgi:hypothetical protein
MAAVLRRLIEDRDYLAGLEARLKARFHPRSWAACAARLIEIACNEDPRRAAGLTDAADR